MTGRLLSVVVISVWLGGSPCLASDAVRDAAPEVEDPLHDLGIEIGGEARAITALEVVGLATIDEAQLWTMVEKPDYALRVRTGGGARRGARPQRGLRPHRAAAARRRVRRADARRPRHGASRASRRSSCRGSTRSPRRTCCRSCSACRSSHRSRRRRRRSRRSRRGRCVPGILRGGVAGAITRLVKRLFDSGYLMVGVQGTLSADGRLTVEVDEGRLEEVRLVGPAPRLWPAVQEALDLPPGRTFDQAELGDALKRVERALPFLQPDSQPAADACASGRGDVGRRPRRHALRAARASSRSRARASSASRGGA